MESSSKPSHGTVLFRRNDNFIIRSLLTYSVFSAKLSIVVFAVTFSFPDFAKLGVIFPATNPIVLAAGVVTFFVAGVITGNTLVVDVAEVVSFSPPSG
jgi:hypothetical protein